MASLTGLAPAFRGGVGYENLGDLHSAHIKTRYIKQTGLAFYLAKFMGEHVLVMIWYPISFGVFYF